MKFGLAATSTQATSNVAQKTTAATTGLAFGQSSTAAGQQPTQVFKRTLPLNVEFHFSRHIVLCSALAFWSSASVSVKL